MGSIGTLFAGKTYAQSEPDIISAVAARRAKRGIAANRLTGAMSPRQSRSWSEIVNSCSESDLRSLSA
jgi:hypothetical protein